MIIAAAFWWIGLAVIVSAEAVSLAESALAAPAAPSAAQLLRKNLRPMRMPASRTSGAAIVTVAGNEPGKTDDDEADPPESGCDDHGLTSLPLPTFPSGIMVCDAMTPCAISRNNGHVSNPAEEHGPIDTT